MLVRTQALAHAHIDKHKHTQTILVRSGYLAQAPAVPGRPGLRAGVGGAEAHPCAEQPQQGPCGCAGAAGGWARRAQQQGCYRQVVHRERRHYIRDLAIIQALQVGWCGQSAGKIQWSYSMPTTLIAACIYSMPRSIVHRLPRVSPQSSHL